MIEELIKIIVIKKAKKLYKKSNDKMVVMKYLVSNYPHKNSSEIIAVVTKIEEQI